MDEQQRKSIRTLGRATTGVAVVLGLILVVLYAAEGRYLLVALNAGVVAVAAYAFARVWGQTG